MTYSAGDFGHVAVHNAIDVAQASVIAAATASAASAALSASLVGAPADVAVAAIVGDPASDTATLLSSTYAPLSAVTYRGNRTVGLGDSNTLGVDSTAIDQKSCSPYAWACYLTNQRMMNVHNAGKSGDTAAMALARVDTECLAYAPDRVVLMIGTNDMPTVDQTALKANVIAILDKLKAAGVTVHLISIPPYLTYKTSVESYNAWLATTAAARGLTFTDIYTPSSNGSGDWHAGYFTNALHFNEVGAQAAGQVIATALSPVLPVGTTIPKTFLGTGERNLNPTGLFATGTAGVPTGWVAADGGATTRALVADAAFVGQACATTRNDATFGIGIALNCSTGAAGAAAGDRFAFSWKWRAPVGVHCYAHVACTDFDVFFNDVWAGDGTTHVGYGELIYRTTPGTASLAIYFAMTDGANGDVFYLGDVAIKKLPPLV